MLFLVVSLHSLGSKCRNRRYLRARSTNNIGTAVESTGGDVDGIGLAGSFRPSMGWTYAVDVVGNHIAVHSQGKETEQVALLARNVLPLSFEIDICIGAEYIQLNMLNAAHDNLMLCLREPQREVVDDISVCELGFEHSADGTELVDRPLLFADHCCGGGK